jgi:hypothetical protein
MLRAAKNEAPSEPAKKSDKPKDPPAPGGEDEGTKKKAIRQVSI